MSLATETKSRAKQSKLTVNLSFDLPLKNNRLVGQPLIGEFTITPSTEGKKMKINLNSARTTLEFDKRILTTKADSLNNRSSKGQKTSLNKVINKSHHNSTANNKIFLPSHTRSLSYGAKQKNSNNKQVPTKIIGQIDDDMVGYTYPSSQLSNVGDIKVQKSKKVQSPLTNPLLKNYDNTSYEDLNIIKQIRNFQSHADEKLREFHLEHIRQNFLMKNSARIIQRAWRTYKTNKIVSGYSQLARKPSGFIHKAEIRQQKRILNVRSCGFKNGKSQLKKSIKQSKQFFIQDVCFEDPIQAEKISEKKRMQMEEIQKWESLIRDLRKSKDIDQVFEKAQQYKQKASSSLSNADRSSMMEAILKIEDYDMKEQQNRKNKQIKVGLKRQEDNLKGPFSPISSAFQIPKNISDPIKAKGVEAQGKRQKLRTDQSLNKQISDFVGINSIRNENYKWQSKEEPIDQQKQIKSKAAKKTNQILYQIDKISPQVFVDLVMQAILEMELNFELPHTWRTFTSKKLCFSQPVEQEKWQGICTNMESIKDYLESLVSYMLEQCPEALVSGFNLPLGPTSIQLLSCFQNYQKGSYNSTNFNSSKQVIAKQMFREHWEYASKQIYFENKLKNQQKEAERINRLKDITKMYFQLVFDSFNECLSPFRMFGLEGAPCSWEFRLSSQNKIESIDVAKQFVKQGFRSLSELAVISCGLLAEDKQPNIPKDVVDEIREERMNIFLESELKAAEWTWHLRFMERSEIKFEIGQYMMEVLFKQASDELRLFFR